MTEQTTAAQEQTSKPADGKSALNAGLGDVFALFDPSGKMRRCGETLDIGTNFFPQDEYSIEMWKELWNASVEQRAEIFAKYGWSVMTGTFVPNDKLRGCPIEKG